MAAMTRKPLITDRLRTYLLGVAIGLMLVGLLMLMRMNMGGPVKRPVANPPNQSAPTP